MEYKRRNSTYEFTANEKIHTIIAMRNFEFRKVAKQDEKLVFSWLDEPHVREFWDNTPQHREDILIFIEGRITPSVYFDGIFTYWIGLLDDEPFAFIMTAPVFVDEDIPDIWKQHLSTTGQTYSLDFCIGSKKHLGKGLAAPVLKAFMAFFHQKNPEIDTFFIDPDENNPRASHVYQKAGFESVGQHKVKKGAFKGQNSLLMVKKI